jgi:uncharacterized protein YcfL
MRLFKLALAAIALSAASLGCVPRTTNSVNLSSDGSYDWIVTDPELAKIASISHVAKAREAGLMVWQVDVTNLTDNEEPVMYRFVFYDANGMVVDSPLTNWQRIRIRGQQTEHLRQPAPEARITDAKLELHRTDFR